MQRPATTAYRIGGELRARSERARAYAPLAAADAQARLNGRRIHCRSTQTAEHLACIFSIGTLFVLTNPDKVRSRQENNVVGYQCQKWPMTLACGYGRPVSARR